MAEENVKKAQEKMTPEQIEMEWYQNVYQGDGLTPDMVPRETKSTAIPPSPARHHSAIWPCLRWF